MVVAIVKISSTWEMHKFNNAKTLNEWWEENKNDGARFYTVNCSSPEFYGEEVYELHESGLRWCPWCRDARKFQYSEQHAVHRCEICHVSENEYWVRRTNGEN